MHRKEFIAIGRSLDKPGPVLIMVHGRGADAEDILGLSADLDLKDFAILAPEASNNSWYPYSFLSPPEKNEPWLSSALTILKEITDDLRYRGFSSKNIYFLGFSQGACLTLEYVTRNATRYGGVVAFTGGLIGDKIYTENYTGDFFGTPILIAGSDPDPHVPAERMESSSRLLTKMNARVVLDLIRNMGHTITKKEIDLANEFVFSVKE